MLREPEFHIELDVGSQFVVRHRPVCRYDERHLGDRLVLEQAVFDFRWPDAVAGADDDVVRSALEPAVAILIATCKVTGPDPVPAERLLRFLGPAEVVRAGRQPSTPSSSRF